MKFRMIMMGLMISCRTPEKTVNPDTELNGVNTLPIVESIVLSPDSVYANSLVTAVVELSDEDEGQTLVANYTWHVIDAETNQDVEVHMGLEFNTLDASFFDVDDKIYVVVTPNDGVDDGASTTSSVVSVLQVTPTLSNVSITPMSSVYNDSLLTCTVSVENLDETPNLTYEWRLGEIIEGNGPTLDLGVTSAMPNDSVECIATATDNEGWTGTNSASVTIDNRPPTVTATISVSGSAASGELTCVAQVFDPDGENPSVSYEWFNSDGSLGSSNPLQLNSNIGGSGSTVDCVAITTDGYGGMASDTVTHSIFNTEPVMTNVTVNPNPAMVGIDDLICQVSATDVDGDPIEYTYVWSDSSGTQQTTTTASITDVLTASSLSSDTYTCEVTPFDGIAYGNSMSTSVIAEEFTGCLNPCSTSLYPNQTFCENDVITETCDASYNDVTWECNASGNFVVQSTVYGCTVSQNPSAGTQVCPGETFTRSCYPIGGGNARVSWQCNGTTNQNNTFSILSEDYCTATTGPEAGLNFCPGEILLRDNCSAGGTRNHYICPETATTSTNFVLDTTTSCSIEADEWEVLHRGLRLKRWTDGGHRLRALEIDLCDTSLRISATESADRGQKTSNWGSSEGMLAAVNGGYFNFNSSYTPDGCVAFGNGSEWYDSGDTNFRSFFAVGPGHVEYSEAGYVETPPYSNFPWMEEAVCGGATIVFNGSAMSNGNSYTNARTAVGYSFNGETLYLLTVDANHGSTGMNMTQLGVEMQNLGADFAIGLDGGGSTTMWTESLGLVNTPKGSTQRTVSNHLGVWIEGGAQGYNCPQ